MLKTKITIVLLCISCNWLGAQQQSNTIKVNSRVVYIDPDPTFKASIVLSSVYSDGGISAMNIDELTANFKKALEKNGFSWNNIKEDSSTFGFETFGFEQEGVVYEFETKSVEEMKRFMKIKLPFYQLQEKTSSIEIYEDEEKKIRQMAFDKAYKKANLIAKTLNKQVGEVKMVESYSQDLEQPYSVAIYHGRQPGEFFYDVNVTYELK